MRCTALAWLADWLAGWLAQSELSCALLAHTSSVPYSPLPLPSECVNCHLQQAGKVKSQTPKVAPTEDKPKKLQGRAKKRMQYNKRFVNVTLTGGKRRMNPK